VNPSQPPPDMDGVLDEDDMADFAEINDLDIAAAETWWDRHSTSAWFVAAAGQFVFDPVANAWRYSPAAGGGLVPKAVITGEVQIHINASQNVLDVLTRQLYSKQITGDQWQIAVMAELKDAHIGQALFARGGRENMTSTEWGRLGGNLADEYTHLKKMIDQIANGEVSWKQAIARIKQYGQASEQAYWREWALAQDRPEWSSLPALNQVPRDGNTDCYGNCQCHLETREDGIYWVLGGAAHCNDCPPLAAGSPYRPGSV